MKTGSTVVVVVVTAGLVIGGETWNDHLDMNAATD